MARVFFLFLALMSLIYFSNALPSRERRATSMCMTDSNCHYGDKCYKNRCWQNLGTMCLNMFSCPGYTTACFDGFCFAQRD